jgi:hypothetical protein
MYTTKKAVKRALLWWCALHDVPVEEVVVFGSSALLFHDLVDLCNDIDIELPQVTIDRLLPLAVVSPIEETTLSRATYLGYEIEHIDQCTDKPWVLMDGLKICALTRLRDDYRMFNRSKDRIKRQRIESAIFERARTTFIEETSRLGDMGEGLKLELLRDGDGDIIVSVLPAEHRFSDQSIEFCAPGNGGGSSPHTFLALQGLMAAMELDKIERPQIRG